MAESTMSETFATLAKSVGRFLGYQTNFANWTTAQADEIDECVQRGIRRFYRAHNWRFLRPSTTLTTTASDSDQDLPDNFGHIIGDLTYAASVSWHKTIKVVPEESLRALQQGHSSLTGKPLYAAVRPKTTTGATGQRWEILFYPTPDAAYVLGYQYQIMPDEIDRTTYTYPYGGMMHAEAILESCLAVAEEMLDDEIGLHNAKYQEALAASVRQDNQAQPEYYGYNGDSSDLRGKWDRRADMSGTTYDGVSY